MKADLAPLTWLKLTFFTEQIELNIVQGRRERKPFQAHFLIILRALFNFI